jgi:Delta24-sterol reductase
VTWNRTFEKKVHELGGQKWLYAHAYYSEEEFDEIYNRKEYNVLREKYHATYLPTVYNKVKVDSEKEKTGVDESLKLRLLARFWSSRLLAGLYGVYKAMRGEDYLLPKASGKNY